MTSSTADDEVEEELVHIGGQVHCPNEDCDWWVPSGMEYLFADHDCVDWATWDAVDDSEWPLPSPAPESEPTTFIDSATVSELSHFDAVDHCRECLPAGLHAPYETAVSESCLPHHAVASIRYVLGQHGSDYEALPISTITTLYDIAPQTLRKRYPAVVDGVIDYLGATDGLSSGGDSESGRPLTDDPSGPTVPPRGATLADHGRVLAEYHGWGTPQMTESRLGRPVRAYPPEYRLRKSGWGADEFSLNQPGLADITGTIDEASQLELFVGEMGLDPHEDLTITLRLKKSGIRKLLARYADRYAAQQSAGDASAQTTDDTDATDNTSTAPPPDHLDDHADDHDSDSPSDGDSTEP